MERIRKDKSKFIVGVRKKLNRLIGMQKGIYHHVDDSSCAHMQNLKDRLFKVIDADYINQFTINEEKDKKGLLRRLSYKDKYLIYYNQVQQKLQEHELLGKQ